jgi:hypothetical protein
MATQNLSEQVEEAVRGSEVERQIEERKRRLQGSAGGGQQSGG